MSSLPPELDQDEGYAGPEIAIIGMAGRFPGAPGVEALWQRLVAGEECVSFFSDQELAESGVPEAVRRHPAYVPARAIVDQPELFDAGLFGMSATEAKVTDPQHRVFLEVAWEALEDAGIDPARYPGAIGVMGGADVNSYALGQLLVWTHDLQSLLGNDKDYLATRVAYKLDLKGPALTIQTACSTSLVATSVACQALLAWQCDVAIAGGVGLAFPQKVGYLFQEGGILSPDGHCRAFDAASKGTVGGDGCGVVVLKRLADALADGDPIRAVIRGIAINNDGADKIGFTAPSVHGQAEVIAMAHGMADVPPDTIGYVECHGTGTQLGDPIEIAALDQVFAQGTDRRGYCPIGSLKSNVGHMNSAAGVGGLIKAALTLERATIPPSLHFERPNPRIGFDDSCFFVNTELRPWPAGPHPRRAAVSSFGVGGTNAHAVLEEAPPRPPSAPASEEELVLLTAQDEVALAELEARLAAHLEADPAANLGDVAWTLQTGRRRLALGKAAVVGRADELPGALRRAAAVPVEPLGSARVALLFPGQGAQHPGMTRELYRQEPVYRDQLDACCEELRPHLDLDLRPLLFADPADPTAAERLAETAVTQPLLFAVEYALAQLWQSKGVVAEAMLGHSVGEYVAACLSGVLSLPDALRLMAARGRLVQSAPRGAMLAVMADEARAAALPGVEVAAVNAPGLVVVAGPEAEIAAAEQRLVAEGVGCSRLRTSHAFHSRMLDGVLDAYRQAVARVSFGSPNLPWISNVTGTWITAQQASSPDYWVQQLRRAVRFADGVGALLAEPDRVLLEVGPGNSLSRLVQQHPAAAGRRVIAGARQPREARPDRAVFLAAAGALSLAGVDLDFAALHPAAANPDAGPRHRVRLPTYPFQRQRYWQGFDQLSALAAPGAAAAAGPQRIAAIPDLLSAPGWQQQRPLPPGDLAGRWLVLADEDGLGPAVADALLGLGCPVQVVGPGALDALDLSEDDAVDALLGGAEPLAGLVHAAALAPPAGERQAVRRGAELLLALVRAAGRRGEDPPPLSLVVLARGLAAGLSEGPALEPLRAPMLGIARVAAQELRGLRARVVEVGPAASLAAVLGELGAPAEAPAFVALRGRHRFVPVPVPVPDQPGPAPLGEGAVVLITGGLGEVGMQLAEHLVERHRARLVLTSRVGLVARSEWDGWLASHAAADPTSQRIRRIREMEARGAEVMPAAVDVADQARMQELVDEVLARWGRLDGVVHAAGVAGRAAFRAAADTTAGHLGEHFRAKIDGTAVLARVLPPSTRFCLLMSSISTWLGGVGLLAYAAANCYLDAFAAAREGQPGPRFQSVAWDAWRPAGADQAGLPGVGLDPAEGAAVLDRVLALPALPAAVVSTLPLAARIADVDAAGRALLERGAAGGRGEGTLHPRPELSTPYTAPRDELEQAIAEIWQELFSLDRVGVHDSFFELGGDSLLAIQLGTRLRERLSVELPINELFEQPTVESVAQRVRVAREAAQGELDEIMATLELVEGLSDAEVQELLARLEKGEA